MKKLDGMKILIYIVAITLSAVITMQFGYLAYLLNFSENIGYSFSIGIIGSGLIVDLISRHMPISFIILFLVALKVTIVLIMSFNKTLQKVKTND